MYERLTSFIEKFDELIDSGYDFRVGDVHEYVHEFLEVMYDGFVDLNYIANLDKLREKANFDDCYCTNIEILTANEVLTCITWILRVDRWACVGSSILDSYIQEGYITAYLKRLRELDTATS